MAKSIKLRIYEILEATKPEDKLAELVNILLAALVVLNVAAVVLETVDNLYLVHKNIFDYILSFSLAVFTIEYLLRIWSCDVDPTYKNPIFGRLKYALTPLAIIDLIVILPSYLAIAFAADYEVVRSLRLLWSFRLLKLHRHSESLQTIINVIKAQKRELAMSFMAIIFFLVISSTMIYFLEHDAQPLSFPSIPETMWWSVLTMTTVGPSIYPITPLGKVIGGLIIILGVATFALPTSILTSGFVDELQRKREVERLEDQGEM